MAPRVLVAAVVLAAATSLARAAHAQGDDPRAEATRAYREGEDAYRARAFSEAAASFERAFGFDPRGASAYNAGLAREASSEPARAADDYAQALGAGDLPDAFARDARARLAALERSVGRVTVRAPSGARVSIAHARGWPAPATIHLEPGAHDLTVALPAGGGTRTRRVSVGRGTSETIEVTEAPPVAADPPIELPPPAAVLQAAPEPAPSHAASWVLFGGAAVLAGASVALYVDGRAARDDFVAGGDVDRALHDKAQARVVEAWIAAGAAVGAAVVGIVLWSSSTSDARAALGVGPGRIALSGAF